MYFGRLHTQCAHVRTDSGGQGGNGVSDGLDNAVLTLSDFNLGLSSRGGADSAGGQSGGEDGLELHFDGSGFLEDEW